MTSDAETRDETGQISKDQSIGNQEKIEAGVSIDLNQTVETRDSMICFIEGVSRGPGIYEGLKSRGASK